MSKKDCFPKDTKTECRQRNIHEGATQASYFVTENRDIMPAERKQYEMLFGNRKAKK
ncbi:hypothetical protein [Halodesulfovibrio spirochaetisodalis]|uniref:hypothetical protein n=1 Tax=Halodesulfovibrio spirochaetisodalis TaxID=1560234 RepID=UPI0012FBE289|nr:hypothetical protein [Halodesulfovibrio spirochaetisodalis]